MNPLEDIAWFIIECNVHGLKSSHPREILKSSSVIQGLHIPTPATFLSINSYASIGLNLNNLPIN